jgi:hypothetical protein
MKHLSLFENFQSAEDLDDDRVYAIYVNDDRTPGGTAEEILRDYNLEANIYDDGTLTVTGLGSDLKGYLEDYNIYFEAGDVTEFAADPGWEE